MTTLTCSIEGCERKKNARGWCATHYMRWRKYGDVNANFAPKRDVKPPCAADGCEEVSRGWHGWCGKHASKARYYGDPSVTPAGGRNLCTIDGCDKYVVGRGLCYVHWQRNRKHGDPHKVEQTPARDKSPHWKGSEASYNAIHYRLRKLFGSAENHTCTDCGGQALHWSYDLKDPDELTDGRLVYSDRPEHYAPRCVPCHAAHDRKN